MNHYYADTTVEKNNSSMLNLKETGLICTNKIHTSAPYPKCISLATKATLQREKNNAEEQCKIGSGRGQREDN